MAESPRDDLNWHPLFQTLTPRRRFSLESPAQGGGGKCITVASQKGGVGKTTTSVNLAAGLGLAGKKCLLFDFDPQSNATSGVSRSKLEEFPESHLAAEAPREAPPFIRALHSPGFFPGLVEETVFENLWVLPSNISLSDIDTIQLLQAHHLDLWREQIQSLKRLFDVILIDCPPSLGGIPTLALSVSEEVIIPVQCEYYAMEGLSQILPVIEEIQGRGEIDLSIAGLLLTMFADELELSRDVLAEIEGYFPDLVYRSIIPRDITLAESASYGLPIFYYSPFSRGAWSYLNLTREVLNHEQSQAGSRTR